MTKQRQAMIVTPKQLRDLADKLVAEFKETHNKTGYILSAPSAIKFQVDIINDSDCSDTWEFE